MKRRPKLQYDKRLNYNPQIKLSEKEAGLIICALMAISTLVVMSIKSCIDQNNTQPHKAPIEKEFEPQKQQNKTPRKKPYRHNSKETVATA